MRRHAAGHLPVDEELVALDLIDQALNHALHLILVHRDVDADHLRAAVDALNAVENARLELFAVPASDSPVAFAPPPGDMENADISEYLAIIIRDNGCGMSPEVASRIFEPFFTTKPVGSGTGMGLSMAYGIVANHKGWIQLESIPGEGTTFAIFLKKISGI